MIKLLIVDDSPLMRRLLTDIFTGSGEFEVTVARSGAEALDCLLEVAPDVVTLDIHMPGMDGLACLDRIMVLRPCPVVMISAFTAEGADETLEAMALGAVDFIEKPRGAVSLEIDALAPRLVETVRTSAGARISPTLRLRERVRMRSAAAEAELRPRHSQAAKAAPERLPPARSGFGLVLVGASTGGPPALDTLLGQLPRDFPWPIVIAQHMPASFTGPLARRLDRLSALNVREVERTSALVPGYAYIARGDADIIISRGGEDVVARTAPRSEAYFWHPSVDRLVESAMRVIDAEQLIGVLLTGMGSDGAEAMARLNARGGKTIAESADSAVVWGMPGALAGNGGASFVQPLDQITETLMALLGP